MNRRSAILLSLVALFAMTKTTARAEDDPSAKPEKLLVYVGTYTQGTDSEGIYRCELNPKTGEIARVGEAAPAVNPSFLAIHPSRRYLYAVNEVGDYQGKNSGAISAFAIDQQTGALTLLNQQPSKGAAPCHLTVDSQGKHVLAANYSGGSVIVLPIQEDGGLGPASDFVQHEGSSVNPKRQQGPHAHSINLDPAGRFAVAADLGLDKLLVYRYDAAKGTLAPNEPAFATVDPGAGPRHLAFHRSGRFAYVINEMQSTITAFDFDANQGALKSLQLISTMPSGLTGGNSTAEVQTTPDGKFLYGSNRGHDSIAAYSIDQKTGKLALVDHQSTGGKTPRNFGVDPTGGYLLAANQSSDSLVVFRIDPKTGKLHPTGRQVKIPRPVCVKMIPAFE